MVLFNYAIREITAKLVYYGPGLGGKTTNLIKIHESLDPKSRGKLISLATEADRTLFFDFLPLDLGEISGYRCRYQLYTVPGQVHYNATRKLVLKGVDAIVFVADSQIEMVERNRESFENLRENLAENGYDIKNIPLVFQFNKQDLPNAAAPAEVARVMGVDLSEITYFEAVALESKGVFETLKSVIKLSIKKLRSQFEEGQLGSSRKAKAKPSAEREAIPASSGAVFREAGGGVESALKADAAVPPEAAGPSETAVGQKPAGADIIHEVDLVNMFLGQQGAAEAGTTRAAEPAPVPAGAEGAPLTAEAEREADLEEAIEESALEEGEAAPAFAPASQQPDEIPGFWSGSQQPEEEEEEPIVWGEEPVGDVPEPAATEETDVTGAGEPVPAVVLAAFPSRPAMEAPAAPPPATGARTSTAPAVLPAEIAARLDYIHEKLPEIEQSLAEIKSYLAEHRSLMNRVIDIALGRMSSTAGSPTSATQDEPWKGQPKKGILNRLFK